MKCFVSGLVALMSFVAVVSTQIIHGSVNQVTHVVTLDRELSHCKTTMDIGILRGRQVASTGFATVTVTSVTTSCPTQTKAPETHTITTSSESNSPVITPVVNESSAPPEASQSKPTSSTGETTNTEVTTRSSQTSESSSPKTWIMPIPSTASVSSSSAQSGVTTPPSSTQSTSATSSSIPSSTTTASAGAAIQRPLLVSVIVAFGSLVIAALAS